jgi:hypothetical protein
MQETLIKYFSPENIKLAYYRVRCWPDKTVKDQVGIRAFGHELEHNCALLSEKLLLGNYKPQRGFKFYVPKASKTLRTKTLLYIEDALVYQAIANKIAEENYHKLNDHESFVFGSVLSPDVTKGVTLFKEEEPNYFFFKFWKNLYQKFKDSIIQSIEVDKVKYKFETDITGFFDCIPHYNLLTILSQEFGVEDPILDLLSECFNTWSGTKDSITPGVGIPQGAMPSFFFANLLLHKLDDIIIGKGYRYYRYMDDINIYGYTEKELLEALLIIDKYTKGNGLSINAKKTSIVEIDEDNDERVKELKKFMFFSLYDSDEFQEAQALGDDAEKLDRKASKLSDQDDNFIFDHVNPQIETLTDIDEIVDYWTKNIAQVEFELPNLFSNPWADLNSLKLKEGIDDLDFIRYSSQYGTSINALKALDIEIKPNQSLLKYWKFSYQKYFWRVNIFGFTLMHYKNNEELKQFLTNLYTEEFESYEWVRYFIILNISLCHNFSDKELRHTYFKLLKEEESDLVKISLYRLLFKHSKNEQFSATLRKELRAESNHYLKLIITDFNKNQELGTLNIHEFINAIGL